MSSYITYPGYLRHQQKGKIRFNFFKLIPMLISKKSRKALTKLGKNCCQLCSSQK